jgi:acyl-coenzyme A synthetase/AMP-(fatty) acid ligase/SAM-dependent methyltransferase/uncharacterized protein YbaR (Trm112 family)
LKPPPTCIACPECHSLLEFKPISEEAGHGLLLCPACEITTPVCHGFPLFPESRPTRAEVDEKWLSKQEETWFPREQYKAFLKEKTARGLRDSYAFFQPFNESSRALLALVNLLSRDLSPGDRILDTWCRTGWTGEWLASLFPQQKIVSVWEGNRDVLGYSGFQYWLERGERAGNLEIVFSDPNLPLPFATDSFNLVIGLDSLHRYSQDVFLPECLRVTRDDGVLFFPHIHLTNSEPEPFFDRGCHQILGAEWQARLESYCENTARSVFIFPEIELFDCGESFTVKSQPDTPHYNGAALIAPAAWDGETVNTAHSRKIEGDDFLFHNPLVKADLNSARVQIAADEPGLPAAQMLSRHPVYHRRLERLLGSGLSISECEVLFQSGRGLNFAEICQESELDIEVLAAAAENLCHREIAFPAAVSTAMASLQTYYGALSDPSPLPDSFGAFWSGLRERYQHHPLMMDEDGVEYDFESVETLVHATGRWLQSISSPGDRVLVCSDNCPELFVLFWACWCTGRTVVSVDVAAPEEVLANIVKETAPVASFSQRPLPMARFQFDSLAPEDDSVVLFSDKIGAFVEERGASFPAVGPDAVAAILFTSGSTGKPKGVRLSHRSLLYSGSHLAGHFNWPSGGRLLALGSTHTMSGLRNPAVAALAAGMTLFTPASGLKHAPQVFSLLADYGITHLSTVPSLLVHFDKLSASLALEARPEHLQQIISTGYSLPASTRVNVEEFLKVPILGYYGLTETGGICLADNSQGDAMGNLGYPIGAIAQVRDANGGVCETGQPGELCIFTPARCSGYLQKEAASSVRFSQGWVCTGDIVSRLEDASFEFIGREDDQVKNRWGETLYLKDIEEVAIRVGTVEDCCALVAPVTDDEEGHLLLLVKAGEGPQPGDVVNTVYDVLRAELGERKLPEKIVAVNNIKRFTNGKADRASMLGELREGE